MPPRRIAQLLCAGLFACGGLTGCASQSFRHTSQPRNSHPVSYGLAKTYKSAANRIVQSVLAQDSAYERLEHLCVRIGHRLSGSAQLEQAIDWAVETMRQDGQENVHREKVMVPHWVRGNESVTMLEPRVERLDMLGLGGSVGTPPGGLTAPVIVVSDEDELIAAGDAVRGKIVLFNKVMPPYDPVHGSGYGTTVKYRTQGAKMAAEHGAVAALVRSVTAKSLATPHTGNMHYDDVKPKIPSAAVTIEAAEMLKRLQEEGSPAVLNLMMEAQTLPDAESGNVIGEIRGSTWPDEVVVMGGHIDSWDVGQGAQDDGGNCIIAMEALHALRKLNMIPKRTIRVVLWTNEENGLAGGRTYAKDHADQLAGHVAAIELDSGVFRSKGYGLSCVDEDRERVAVAQLQEILGLLSPAITGLSAKHGGGGADISPMRDAGVVLMGHRVHGDTYFDYHHTQADTIDKIDPDDLTHNVAILATVAYVLADMPQRFGEAATP